MRPPPRLDDPRAVAAYDDLPLWSAAFGLRLLDTVELRAGITALDLGCGTGFPLVELAERLGPTSRVHGVDPWTAGLDRVRDKIRERGVENVTLHAATAEAIPLPDGAVDLVVSNNGLNNVADLERALAECARVTAPGGQLVFTWNLPDSMLELYQVLAPRIAARLGEAEAALRVREHIWARRKPIAAMRERVERAGFAVRGVTEGAFALRFADGTALLAHSFVRLAFLESWLALVAAPDRAALEAELRAELDAVARRDREVRLSIPFACLDAVRDR